MFNSYNNSTPSWNNQYSNVAYVTSLEEALMRASTRGTEDVYFHQSKPIFYRVKVDYDGRKSWAAFSYTYNNTDGNVDNSNIPITKDEFVQLRKDVDELKQILNAKEVKDDG